MSEAPQDWKPGPPMSEAVKAVMPTEDEKRFSRAFGDGNIDYFFSTLRTALADADTNPVPALHALREVLGKWLVAWIHSNDKHGPWVGGFGRYQGPSDFRRKWRIVCLSPFFFPDRRAKKIRKLFDKIWKWIDSQDDNAGITNEAAPSASVATVRLAANLAIAVGCYLFEVEATRFLHLRPRSRCAGMQRD